MHVIHRLQDLEFEWDEKKAKSNIRKHGVSFEEAAEAFLDPFFENGDASVDDERRDYIIGYSLSSRLLLIVYTERGHRNRIISARLVTQTERKSYEEA